MKGTKKGEQEDNEGAERALLGSMGLGVFYCF
jgi:hypothetical protein